MARPRSGKVLKCSECGTEVYVAPSQVTRFKHCSHACMWKDSERRRRTSCVKCGKAFEQSPSVGGKYCSRRCYLSDRQKRADCAVCGKALAQNEITYCSQECMATGRRTLEQRPCEFCGTAMKVQPYLFGKKRACSRVCNDKLKEGRLQGIGNKGRRSDGYIEVYYPTHPDAKTNGRILEHRLVMEQKIGRRLLKTEQVNHINHIRDDNRPENLEIMTPGDHAQESNAFGKKKRQSQRELLAAYQAKYGPLESD